MQRVLGRTVLLVVLAVAAEARAQGGPDADASNRIEQAMSQQFAARQYAAAEASLASVESTCAGQCTNATVARAYMNLGVVRCDGLANPASAREAFGRAVAFDPQVALDRRYASDQAAALFHAAGGTNETGAPAAAPPPPAPPAPPVAPVSPGFTNPVSPAIPGAPPTAPPMAPVAPTAPAAPLPGVPTAPPAVGPSAWTPTAPPPTDGPGQPPSETRRRLGTPGVSFSLERAFGLSFFSMSTKVSGGSKVTTSGSTLTLLAGSSDTNTLLGDNPLAMPRLAIDGFPVKGLSLGGSLGYYSTGGTGKAGSHQNDLTATNGFIIAPRVGYAAMFTDGFGIWPRLGFTYANVDVKGSFGELQFSMEELSPEFLLVLSPWAHFALTVGAVVDVPVGASLEGKSPGGGSSTKFDFSLATYGATIGLVGYL